MAVQLGSLYVSLTAETSPYARAMSGAQTVTERAVRGINRSLGTAERTVSRFNRSGLQFRPGNMLAASRSFDLASDRVLALRGALLSTTAIIGGFGAALTSNLIVRYADTFTSLSNRVRVVSEDSADLAAKMEQVGAVAERSRSSLQATAILYSRLAKAAPTKSADEMLRAAETINKALQLGGATAQEAYSTAVQLSQGIASNRLGGEELRAILETPLGLELARGLDVTIGKLREMGHAGQLTSDVVLRALGNISGSIDEQFERSIRTVDQALTHLDNRLIEFFGSVNQTYGVTQQLANTIVGLGDNIGTILPVVGYLAAAFGVNWFSKLIVGSKTLTDELGNVTRAGHGTLGVFERMGDRVRGARAEVVQYANIQKRIQRDLDAATLRRARAAEDLVLGDASGTADKSTLSALKRAEAQIAAVDNNRLKVIDGLIKKQDELGRVTSSMTSGAVADTNKIIKAEKAHADALTEVGRRRLALEDARKSVADAVTASGGVGRNQMQGFYKAAFDRDEAREALEAARGIERAAKEGRVEITRAMQTARAAGREDVAEIYRPWAEESKRAVKQSVAQRVQAHNEMLQSEYRFNSEVSRLDTIAARGKQENVDKAVRAREAAAQRLVAAERSVAAARLKVNEESAAAIERASAVDQASQRKRLALMHQIDADRARLAENDKQRVAAVAAQQDAVNKVTLSGYANLSRNADEAARQVAHLTDQSKANSVMLAGLQKAARGGALAFGAISYAARGFMGVLGGPFGVALTAAILLLGKLGQNAAEKAQQVANATNLIDEAIKRAGSGSGAAAAAAGRSVLSTQLEKTKEELDAVRNGFTLMRRELLTLLSFDLSKVLFFTATPAEINQVREYIVALFEAVNKGAESGGISFAEYQAQIERLVQTRPELGPLKESLIDAGQQADRARQAADQYGKEIDELDGKVAKVRIETAFETVGPQGTRSGREAEDKSMIPILKAAGEYTDQTSRQTVTEMIKLSELRSKGLNAEAEALEFVAKEAAEGRVVSESWAIAKFKEIEANKASTKELKQSAKEYERLKDIIGDIQGQGAGAFLGELDRKVIDKARKLPGSASLIQQYVDAVESGNLAKMPNELRQIRDALLEVQAAEDYRSIVQQYGNGSQQAQEFADKQAILNKLVADGKITAEQGRIAWADYLGEFDRFSWIDDASNALGQFASSAATDFKNIGDHAVNMANQIRDAVMQALIIQPLINSLKGFMGSFFGGPAAATTAVPMPVPRPVGLSGGGYTGAGGMFEPKGIVHGGEFVFSKKAVGAIGLGNLEMLHRRSLRGFASGGYVGTSALDRYGGLMGGGVVVNNYGPREGVRTRRRSDGTTVVDVFDVMEGEMARRVGSRRGRLAKATRSTAGNGAGELRG